MIIKEVIELRQLQFNSVFSPLHNKTEIWNFHIHQSVESRGPWLGLGGCSLNDKGVVMRK